ncbi:MAG: YbfB/YjiJ family MFS transporter [Rhodoferax sp.]|nr:YbfB/YjiJ family MFS transporter [Rhodoferax sp.]
MPATPTVRIAIALSLGAALSLGVARFAYGLLLPPMRADLGWSYVLAGAMNTSNAAGYLLGALAAPWLMRRWSPGAVLMAGSLLASGLLAVGALFTGTTAWLVQRLLVGVGSALVFSTGGLLAARLGATDPGRAGLLIGLYYGGTGLGITLSALTVPWVLEAASAQAHPWAWGWAALAVLCGVATVLLRWPVRQMARIGAAPAPAAGSVPAAPAPRLRLRPFAFGLAGYAMFGVGYIGYMTFVIALLREQGQSPARITVFYALLGVAVMVSPRLWAWLLDRYRDGRPLALLNALLGVATLLPAVAGAWPLVMLSGLLFGAVFLSLVASTTALVRHNLPPAQWAAGIAAFTIVFAAGQIIGPTMVGWVSDGPGGLQRGFVLSAVALWIGAALALRQRALPRTD